MRTLRALTGAALIAGAIIVGPAPVAAKSGDVVRVGNCTRTTDWKLKAGHRDGGIEMEYQVDSNRNGQKWRVRIYDNGVLVYAADRSTVAPSGSFTVHRKIANRAGSDTLVARARNLTTGETCSGKIVV